MSTALNQYHNEFAALVKITMRDGDASASEQQFLQHLSNKLGMGETEFKSIMKNYLSYPLETIPVNYKKLENLYTLTQLICDDGTMEGKAKILWLERMGKGMGFTHENVPYIADKAIKMVEEGADLTTFVSGIQNINQ